MKIMARVNRAVHSTLGRGYLVLCHRLRLMLRISPQLIVTFSPSFLRLAANDRRLLVSSYPVDSASYRSLMAAWFFLALLAFANANRASQTPFTLMEASQSQFKVPGDSPVYYIGDPSNDILSIQSLDLIPNPPDEYASPLTPSLQWMLTSQ